MGMKTELSEPVRHTEGGFTAHLNAYVETCIEERDCKKMQRFQCLREVSGGDGGIRTLDTLVGYAHLANECLQPLGHVSGERLYA